MTILSAPHLAAVALPAVALLSQSSSAPVATPKTPSSSPPPGPRMTLWQDVSLDQFVVDTEPTNHIPPDNALSLTQSPFAMRVTNAVRDWTSLMSVKVDVLSEVAGMQAQDDGDEQDWYAHEKNTTRACSLDYGRIDSSGSSNTSRSLVRRSRSCSDVSVGQQGSGSNVSADELRKRLFALALKGPSDCVLLEPPPSRRRRAA